MAKFFGYIDDFGVKCGNKVAQTTSKPLRFIYRMLSGFSVWLFLLLSFILLLSTNLVEFTHGETLPSDYEILLDLSEMNVTTLIPSLTYNDASTYNMANKYVFGWYGFCRSNNNNGNDYKFSNGKFSSNDDINTCMNNDACYGFDLKKFFVDEFGNQGSVSLTEDEINLPHGLAHYSKTSHNASQMAYVTSIMAIILSFAALLLFFITHLAKPQLLKWCFVLVVFSFITSLMSAAAATGVFMKVRDDLNNVYNEFGITAKTSNNFFGLIWVSCIFTVISFLSMLLYLRSRSKRRVMYVSPKKQVVVVEKAVPKDSFDTMNTVVKSVVEDPKDSYASHSPKASVKPDSPKSSVKSSSPKPKTTTTTTTVKKVITTIKNAASHGGSSKASKGSSPKASSPKASVASKSSPKASVTTTVKKATPKGSPKGSPRSSGQGSPKKDPKAFAKTV
ncbi:unnamed protein product [Ambrosiozyma monospora]|uniref:Unnamed protein product n=1 Tax=Ambrosiozyma monospora TaxID=43982 RepID=A0ACB5SXF2_AMBMO|nr:unnamed protein product [Ambrosiozyma monospora]